MADPQYADRDTLRDLNRDFRGSLGKISVALDDLGAQELAFIVVLGDLVDGSLDDFQPVLKLFEQSKHKIYPVFGNHDYIAAGGDRQTLAKLLNLENTYYSWSQGGYRFVVLDTNDGEIAKKGFSRQKEHDLEAQMGEKLSRIDYWLTNQHAWNGYVLDEQQEWLIRELEAARAAQEKVVLFGHDPLYPMVYNSLRNADEILRLLDKQQVAGTLVGYFAGHHHDGAYAELFKAPFITFKAMVTDNGTAYSVVELDGLNVKTCGFGTENSYIFREKG